MQRHEKYLAKTITDSIDGHPQRVSLPFATYTVEVSQMLPFCPIHWHEETEIVKVQSGEGNFCIDGKWYRCSAGDILILRPFVMHSVSKVEGCKTSVEAALFNLRLLGNDDGSLKYFAPLLNEKNALPCIVRPTESWYQAFDQSLAALFAAEKTQVKEKLQGLFKSIYVDRLVKAKPNIAEEKRSYTVKLALGHIRAEYKRNITVAELADLCGYSEFYLMKLFKQATGCSCVDYLNNFRLTLAGRQLLDTSDDIAAIATDVGFNNISYFNRQFKRLYAMTPKQFRKAAEGC